MKITLRILGERLKELRQALDLTQGEIAEHVNVNQNSISRIENGVGGSIDVLLGLINFYKEYFFIQELFSHDFQVISLFQDKPELTLESVAVERLKMLREDFCKDLDNVIKLLDPQ